MYIRFDKHAIYRVFPVSPGKLWQHIEASKMKQEVRVHMRSQSLTSSADTVILLYTTSNILFERYIKFILL